MKYFYRKAFYFLYFISSVAFAQQVNNSGGKSFFGQGVQREAFAKMGDIFGTRVFVENRGQFKNKRLAGEKILYCFEQDAEKIYFTSKGLMYEMVKEVPLTEEEREELEHGREFKKRDPEVYFVNMNWQGMSEAVNVEASEKQGHYITYGAPEFNSATFKKLTYRNVYPNIDIEYVIPTDKAYGIKYNVIVHEGANVNDIRILYSGDVKKIRLNKVGDVIIDTPLEDITEHAPSAFYQDGGAITSAFILEDNIISFQLAENNPTKRIVIDPWVTSITSLSSTNNAFDVDYDFGMNVYIYGGSGTYKIARYNALGVLQWTFSGTVVSPSWNTTSYASNFAVDKFTSKCFTGQGFNGSGAQVIRIDGSGNYDNFISVVNSQYREIWEMGFHCLSPEVFIFGGTTANNMSAATINSTNATLNLSTFQPTIAQCCQDIVSYAIDDQGQIFVLFATGSGTSFFMNNKMSLVNTTFNGNIWTQPTGFTSMQENGNKGAYQPGVTSNGFNALAVNGNYLFYYDGLNLSAYNKTTGANVANTSIPGATLKRQGGIAVDDCNNLYLGGNGSILTYNFNGVNFSALTPIALGVTLSTQDVHDIKLDRNTKTLFICGTGFVGTYAASLSFTCGAPPGLCLFNQAGIGASSTSITCATLGSATVTPNGGLGPYSYTWIPSGQTGSVGTGLSPGTYTIIVYDAGYFATYTTTTSFVSAIPLTGNVLSSNLTCNGATNATAAVVNLAGGSGSQTYLWNNGVSTWTTAVATATGLGAGNYTVTVTDGLTGCVLSPTFNVWQPSALGSYITVSSPTACVGTSILLTGVTSGGIPGYTYTWTGGPQTTTRSVSESPGGTYTYTLTSRDFNNCLKTASVQVDFVDNPVITIANVSVCPLQTGTLTPSGATSYTWSNNTFGNFLTDNPAINTAYTATGSALGCTSTASGYILFYPLPTPGFTSNSPVCNGQTLQLSGSGGTGYKWTGPQNFNSLSQNPVVNAAAPNNSGVYNLTVTSVNGCTASTNGSLTVDPTPTLSAFGSTVCSNGVLTLQANSFTGATFAWTGPNSYSSIQQNPNINTPAPNQSGFYTVVATSAVGCTNTAVAQVTVTQLPTPTITSDAPKCTGSTINLTGSGGISYSWAGPNGFNSLLQNPFIVNAQTAATGDYSLTVTTGPCIASTTQSLLIYPLPVPSATYIGIVCETKTLGLQASTAGPVVSYFWQGPGGYISNQPNPVRPNSNMQYSGTYTLTVTDLHACKASAQTTVTIQPNPVIIASGATVCLYQPAILSAAGAASYFWTGPSFYQSGQQYANIPSVTKSMEGIYTVLGTALNTCTSTATVSVGSHALPVPAISVLPGTDLCLNDIVSLTGSGGIIHKWFGPASAIYDGTSITITLTSMSQAGTYTLLATDATGCFNMTNTFIKVNALPEGVLEGDNKSFCAPFCANYKFIALNSNSVHSTWELNKRTFGDKFTYCFSDPGTFVFNGVLKDDLTNCKHLVSSEVIVHPKPDADFEFLPEHPVENNEVKFYNTTSGEEQVKWTWFFDGQPPKTTTGEQAVHLYQDAGSYVTALMVSNRWNCTDTIVKSFTVDQDFNIYVPNVFTPNGDGLNDSFQPVTRGIKLYNLKVFDRWGAMIFESSDANNAWDGTYKEEPCKSDVYSWTLRLSSIDGNARSYKGHVTLLRGE